MAYQIEDLQGHEPTRLVGEHCLLVQWLKDNPLFGRVEYFEPRLVDLEKGLALYYIKGFGMDCMSFALVREQDIFVFEAQSEVRSAGTSVASISDVGVPAGTRLSRPEIQSLIASGFSSYGQLLGFNWAFPNDDVPDFNGVQWKVLPPVA